MIKKINLEEIQEQIDSQQLSVSEQSPKRTERQEQIIDTTWKTLVGIYGSTIVSAFGVEMPEEWIALLKGITPNQIADGLTKLKDRESPFHPNGAEFRQLCLPETTSPDGKNTSAYLSFDDPKHPEYEHYQKPKRIENKTVISKRKQTGNNALNNLKGMLDGS